MDFSISCTTDLSRRLDLPADQINFVLDVTAVSGTTPTLDIALQTGLRAANEGE